MGVGRTPEALTLACQVLPLKLCPFSMIVANISATLVLLATMLASYVLGASSHSLAPQAMQSYFVLLLGTLQQKTTRKVLLCASVMVLDP